MLAYNKNTDKIPSFCLRCLFASFRSFFIKMWKNECKQFSHDTILHHSSFLHALKVVSVNLQMDHVFALYLDTKIITIKIKIKIKNYKIFDNKISSA